MKKNLIMTFASFLVLSSLVYYGCKDNSTNPPVDNGGETVSSTISGSVLDESNAPVSGALVETAGQTTTTNGDGTFLFSGIQVPKSRFVVNVTKSGYFRGSCSDTPVANGTSTIKIYLMQAGVTQTIDATSGGEAALQNGSKVVLNSNSIAASDGSVYNGNVNLSLGYLDPTSENFSNMVPGGDMQAQRTDNSQATLYSYGIIRVQMKGDGGQDLNLKSGSQSEITVDIPPSMSSSAPATIPLWHYDQSTGLWKEEGTATKQGDKYVGTVGHFSDWNCDVPQGTASVSGLVVDCNNQPVQGISVHIGQVNVTTGTDGRFDRRVPANTAFEVQVLGNANFGLGSDPVAVPALTEGATHDVGTLHVDCPAYVKGLIKCGTDVKYGQVTISWDGGYNVQYTGSDGSFNIATDIDKPAQLSVYSFDGSYTSMNITTPSVRGNTLDLGTIQVCEQVQTGDNKFTVNGSGYNNTTLTFASDTNQVFGYFDPTDSLSFIYMYKVTGTDTTLLWFSFYGTNTGTPSDISMYFYHNAEIFYAFAGLPGSSVTLNVSSYGGIGGLIEGTFGGTLTTYMGGTGITISDGQFSVIRIILTKQLDKLKDKFPAKVRQMMK